jgi:hypothetical protein
MSDSRDALLTARELVLRQLLAADTKSATAHDGRRARNSFRLALVCVLMLLVPSGLVLSFFTDLSASFLVQITSTATAVIAVLMVLMGVRWERQRSIRPWRTPLLPSPVFSAGPRRQFRRRVARFVRMRDQLAAASAEAEPVDELIEAMRER